MALRSVGIPATFEFVPYWGSNNNGHSFVSIILPDNKIYPLQNTGKQANEDYYLSRKAPKIYRKVYSIQDLAKHVNNIPELFRHNDILDVTRLYNISSCDITVSTNINKEKDFFYLYSLPKDGDLLICPLLKHSITLGLGIDTMLIVIRKLLI